MFCRSSLRGVSPSSLSNPCRARFIAAANVIGRPPRPHYVGTLPSLAVPPAARKEVLGLSAFSFRQLRRADLSTQAADFDPNSEHMQRTSTIVVGPLFPGFGESSLRTAFATCGKIVRVNIEWRFTEGELLGYGYVNFGDVRAVERALQLDLSILRRQTVHIRAIVVDRSTLTVQGLAWGVDKTHLRSLFEQYGEVIDVRVRKTSPHKGQRRTLVFIRFSSPKSASRAFRALDRTSIDGETISISYSTSAQKSSIYHAAKREPIRDAIVVEGLPPQVRDDSLKAELERFGTIDFVRVQRDLSTGGSFGTGNSLGYAYVRFTSAQVVDEVLGLDKCLTIAGRPIRIRRAPAFLPALEPSRVHSGEHDPTTVWVSGLTRNVDGAQLRKQFKRFGQIKVVYIHRDRVSHKSRGFGFVTFASPEALEEALQLDGEMKIDGFAIKIQRTPGPIR
ncbi:unnamed protein product [Peniophora sp. CBMAI 1063]|nr:unnamed protein product [Peniophora sp. CBMAI 1063]